MLNGQRSTMHILDSPDHISQRIPSSKELFATNILYHRNKKSEIPVKTTKQASLLMRSIYYGRIVMILAYIIPNKYLLFNRYFLAKRAGGKLNL